MLNVCLVQLFLLLIAQPINIYYYKITSNLQKYLFIINDILFKNQTLRVFKNP